MFFGKARSLSLPDPCPAAWQQSVYNKKETYRKIRFIIV
jgi:hypothetical protein